MSLRMVETGDLYGMKHTYLTEYSTVSREVHGRWINTGYVRTQQKDVKTVYIRRYNTIKK